MASTTGLFYTVAGKASPIDFYVGRSVLGQGITWMEQWNYGSGDDVVDDANSLGLGIIAGTQSGYFSQMHRSQLHFNCASIPDNAVIQSASLRLYIVSTQNTINMTTPKNDFVIVSATCASDTQATASDYYRLNYGTTPLAARVAQVSLTVSTNNTFALNLTGLAYISKTGLTRFGLRWGCDVDNSAPAFVNRGWGNINVYAADISTATSTSPMLSVVYFTPIKNIRFDSAGTKYTFVTDDATATDKFRCYSGATVLGFSVVSTGAANASAYRCCTISGTAQSFASTAT